MPAPLFEFFEVIAEELSATPSTVITYDDLRPKNTDSILLEQLTREMWAANAEDAIERAVESLQKQFQSKDSRLPFDYNPQTSEFTATDPEFLAFVKKQSRILRIRTKSCKFECNIVDDCR